MGEFNLLDEKWINVVTDYKGTTKPVGIKDFFENAHNYIALAGDTPTQDFAVMRFLLAVLHTVFSRYDADGNAYEMLEMNDRMQPKEEPAEDLEEYEDLLMDTWKDLWNKGNFPKIVNEYLEEWKDRFNLFDDKYPFYQVTEKEIDVSKINKSAPSEVLGKNINRRISESANKIALFSPKYSNDLNKEKMSQDEVARWLLTFQSYSGLSDKVIFGKEKYKASKGWLFDLGGVFLSSDNLFKTLLLNLQLKNFSNKIQKPCWEFSPEEVVQKQMSFEPIDNIAELYTVWSRAVCIKDYSPENAFSMSIVKLPEVIHEDQFLEPMTIWRYNTTGDNKEKFTPRKHQMNKSMWRSFGLITETESEENPDPKNKKRKPGIIDWMNKISDFVDDKIIKINSISMEDDGNATSWVPTNEVVDHLYIDEAVFNDLEKEGWIYRINKVVDMTKEVVEFIYKGFLNDINEIRNLESKDFVNNGVELLYYEIDKPFRDWILSIDINDDKEKKITDWKNELSYLVFNQAEKIAKSSNSRDFIGISVDGTTKNIATAFNIFSARLNKKLGKRRELNGENK
ncbi:CRISPR system Cascade subunit CasA [Ezakiella coagulans]|uniref:CRISPR system Cascade subunit CasA n=1 Tax=Ezakiella coagulans TaxID=46507 RepID=A0A2U1E6D0_9FIRM|nr:type I-E CRISPR-associated protein Cse1/CasA [Ezakiella coagulans]PVY95504.1 CRISPR system Cascade subunit CasA [Ezakiella coagulans]